MPEVIFTTFGGLRGAVSLILAQAAVAEDKDAGVKAQRITAQVSPHALDNPNKKSCTTGSSEWLEPMRPAGA